MSVPRPRLVPLMLRELRGSAGRMAFFVLCLAVGVAAVVAVAGVSGGLDSGLRKEGRQLLAADLEVRGPEPAPAALGAVLERLGDGGRGRRADLRELVTMVSVDEPGARSGPVAGRARRAEPPGPRENLAGGRSTRASARPTPDRAGTDTADAGAGLDALRPRPDAPARTPTSSADEAGSSAGNEATSDAGTASAQVTLSKTANEDATGGGGDPMERDPSSLS